jgi:hypothetical protein
VLSASTAPKTRRLSVSSFRGDVNSWASCLDPSSYPGVNGDNGTSLPQTVPSIWFSMSSRSGNAVLEGRGWGHGVGMVQWGAYGKAKRGLSYRTILADYYGGLTPVSYQDPATIRVGIATGLETVQVAGTGTVSATGTNVSAGPWTVGGGKHLRVRDGPRPPVYLRSGSVLSCPTRAAAGRRIGVRITLPQLSVVRVLMNGGGQRAARQILRPVTLQPGTQTLRPRIPGSTVTGTYRVRVETTNGIDIVSTRWRQVRVRGASPQPSPTPSPAPPSPPASTRAVAPAASRGGSPLWLSLGAAAAVVAAAAALVLLRLRFGRRPRAVPGPAGPAP